MRRTNCRCNVAQNTTIQLNVWLWHSLYFIVTAFFFFLSRSLNFIEHVATTIVSASYSAFMGMFHMLLSYFLGDLTVTLSLYAHGKPPYERCCPFSFFFLFFTCCLESLIRVMKRCASENCTQEEGEKKITWTSNTTTVIRRKRRELRERKEVATLAWVLSLVLHLTSRLVVNQMTHMQCSVQTRTSSAR